MRTFVDAHEVADELALLQLSRIARRKKLGPEDIEIDSEMTKEYSRLYTHYCNMRDEELEDLYFKSGLSPDPILVFRYHCDNPPTSEPSITCPQADVV